MEIAGSALMALGAVAIGMAAVPESELHARHGAAERECRRYGLDRDRVIAALHGDDPLARTVFVRRRWEWMLAATATGIAVWLARELELITNWQALLK